MSPDSRRPNDIIVKLDPIHEAATEAAMVVDRAAEARGERVSLRRPFAHELCPSAGRCIATPADVLVRVIVHEPGVRSRALVGLATWSSS